MRCCSRPVIRYSYWGKCRRIHWSRRTCRYSLARTRTHWPLQRRRSVARHSCWGKCLRIHRRRHICRYSWQCTRKRWPFRHRRRCAERCSRRSRPTARSCWFASRSGFRRSGSYWLVCSHTCQLRRHLHKFGQCPSTLSSTVLFCRNCWWSVRSGRQRRSLPQAHRCRSRNR